MLVNLKEILSYAEKNQCAIGAFNTPNFECIMAVLQNAETYQIPVIISHAQVHESIMYLETIGPIMVLCAERSTVPVCVHLDHGESLDYIEKALESGFTSVMYDGSKLAFEKNVENTLRVVKMARKYGAGIEAEIGVMASGAGSSEGIEGEKGIYTEPDIAKKFVEMTNVDALAASFGTAHGIYAEKPRLDFQRIESIKELTKTPLVMHGGSGLTREDYITAIEKGIRKINYYTYMSGAAVSAVKKLLNEQRDVLFHDVALTAVESMKQNSEKAMKVFYKIP